MIVISGLETLLLLIWAKVIHNPSIWSSPYAKPDLDFAYFETEGLPTYVLKVSLKMALEVYSDQGSAQCGLVTRLTRLWCYRNEVSHQMSFKLEGSRAHFSSIDVSRFQLSQVYDLSSVILSLMYGVSRCKSNPLFASSITEVRQMHRHPQRLVSPSQGHSSPIE